MKPKRNTWVIAVVVAVLAPGATPWADAAPAQASGDRRAYVTLGLGALAPRDARFADGADTGHAMLYGGPELFTTGDFAAAPLLHVAAGYRVTPRLRVQAEFGLARQLEFRGTVNYPGAGAVQPSVANLRTRQFLVAGLYDIAVWQIGPLPSVETYVGAGAGFTDYRLDDFVMEFPAPDDAAGYLRRGPDGEVPFTGLPPGSGRSATRMVTAGVALAVSARVRFDLAYRFTDAGSVGTPAGSEILIVRYHRGHRSELEVPINETTADRRTHAVLATLRLAF